MQMVRTAVRRRPAIQISEGGLLVVGGPPLEGKGLVAARLAEWLPFGVKIESVDSLVQEEELWFRYGPAGPAVVDPHRQMLTLARRIWERRQRAKPPVIVLSARFSTPAARAKAAAVARSARMKFLFVEARSSQIRALRRIPPLETTAEGVVSRVELYEKILERYEPVTVEETKTMMCVRLKNTLGSMELAIHRVVTAWDAGSPMAS